MSNKKASKEQLDKAKSLYMDYKPLSQVASAAGLTESGVRWHIDKKDGWRSERVLRSTQLASEFSEAKLNRMNSTFSNCFSSIEAWVKEKSARPQELKPFEIKTMMSIIQEMDKISRLDAGNPTDIIAETRPIDVKEVRAAIAAADPFMIDADYKEIKDAEESQEEDV
jgi:hypothetical protein